MIPDTVVGFETEMVGDVSGHENEWAVQWSEFWGMRFLDFKLVV